MNSSGHPGSESQKNSQLTTTPATTEKNEFKKMGVC
jgi:hypothetical protein